VGSAGKWSGKHSMDLDTAWTWTQLPAMSVARFSCCGCLMSDSRFTVLGGITSSGDSSSCEALVVTEGGHWVSHPPMHHARRSYVCAAVAGYIIVAGGHDTSGSAEVHDEVLNRWTRLPYDLPGVDTVHTICRDLL